MTPASQRKLDPETICTRVVARLIKEIACVAITPESPAWQDILRQGTRVGELRVYRGRGRVQKVVSASFALSNPAVDSHSVIVFTDPASPVPHFVLGSLHVGPRVSFHVDLLPKRDLAVSLTYLDRCYAALNQTRSELSQDSRFVPTAMALRQRALLSPWSAAYSLEPEHLEAAASYIDRYIAQWASLLASDAPELHSVPELSARDALHRRLLFSRDGDPAWSTLDRMLGRDSVDQLLEALSE